MSWFKAKRFLSARSEQMPEVVNEIRREFEKDRFIVKVDDLVDGGRLILVDKGNFVDTLFGLRLTQKVWLTPSGNHIFLDTMSDRNDIITTAFSCFLFWGGLLTLCIGLYKQSRVCKRVLSAAERVQNNMIEKE
jgi:hypothetical protein